jgi:hypothetical protein
MDVRFGPKADMQESGSKVVVLTRIILCAAASGFISCFRLQNGDSVVHRQWRNLHKSSESAPKELGLAPLEPPPLL